MRDKVLKQHPKRLRRFTCSTIFLLSLIAAVLFFNFQLHSVGMLILEAASGEAVASGLPIARAPVYVAKLGNEPFSTSALRTSLDSGGQVEVLCQDGSLQVRGLSEPAPEMFDFPSYIRLVNLCDNVVSLKLCWLNSSIFDLFLSPACEI